MDLVSLLGLVRQHWKAVVPVLLLTVALATSVQQTSEPLLEAQGSVLIATADHETQVAPADIIDPAEITEIVRLSDATNDLSSGTPPLEVTLVPAAANIVQIVVTGDEEAAVTSGVEELVQLVVSETQALQVQADIPDGERIEARPLTDNVEAVQQTGVADGEASYTATVGVRFNDPAAGIENPYTASRGTGRLLEVAVQSDAGRATVNERTGAAIDFSVAQEDFDQAPILQIVTYGTARDETIEGFDNVVATMADYLDDRQARAGVPGSARLSAEVVAAPLDVRDVSPPISRAVAVTIGLGLVLALAAAILAENLATRRAKLNHASSPRTPQGARDPVPEQRAPHGSDVAADDPDDARWQPAGSPPERPRF